jgi:CheY-like chemotaxis protein
MSQDHDRPVLVVEDEVFIRMVAVDTLEDCGYSILEAGNAQEAILLLERTPEISLIFTDINMPGNTDGLDLAEEVSRRWPNTKIIVTSGAQQLTDDDIPDGGRFLGKPYSPKHLEKLVSDQMGGLTDERDSS